MHSRGEGMARRTISIDEKIKNQKEVVFALKDKYEAAVEELNKLIQKKKELQNKELMKAIEGSSKSMEEILEFLKEDAEE